MTDDAGIFSLDVRALARSGAETGGGMTARLVICTGELESSRLTPPGEGGITLAASVVAEREWSRSTVGAGAITDELREAVERRRSFTLGAGGITAGVSAGATSTFSRCTSAAGGITIPLRSGVVSLRPETDGAGGITASSGILLRV
jgi:hypothetical protein